jgi:L-2-hydroxyglutarate oxidase LhgO
MDRVECIVAGAGVIGLAVARALARAGREVLILESADRFGTGISSRNSEVIHAGFHYAPGSLKTDLCIASRAQLTRYCEERGVAHRICGKLVVATSDDEIEGLRALQAKAAGNGVALAWLDGAEARTLEPALRCVAALHSPTTGIVDSHGLMRALLMDAEAAGACLVTRSPVLAAHPTERGLRVQVGGDDPSEVEAGVLVNAAGLGAAALAAAVAGAVEDAAAPPRVHLAKGSYFGLAGRAPFTRLVYPLPVPAALGVHLTLDLAGQARFGPDLEWVEGEDFDVDPRRADAFYAEVRKYWPDLADGALVPAYAGIRPKLQGPGEGFRDFLIQGPEGHGVPGLWNLLGIESPGLTACLSLADHVAQVVAAASG